METIVELMTPEGPPRASAVPPELFRDFDGPLEPATEGKIFNELQ